MIARLHVRVPNAPVGWLPISVVGFAVLVPLTMLCVGTWLAGWRLQPVETASMSPAYAAGSLLAVAPIDAADVRPGMVIVFANPSRHDQLIAHRVIARLADGSGFRTQGDANDQPDPLPVDNRMIRGRVRWGIAGLGRAALILRWPVNALVFMGVPALLLLATELMRWRPRARLGVRPAIRQGSG